MMNRMCKSLHFGSLSERSLLKSLRFDSSIKVLLALLLMATNLASRGQSIEERITTIKNEYRQINSVIKYKTDTVEVTDESTEGGCVIIYRDKNGEVRKVVKWLFFESGKYTEEYYAKDGKPFFVFTKVYRYNCPFYFDKLRAKEVGAKEWFDDKKTRVYEDRYYFNADQTLFQHIDSNKKIIRERGKLKEIEVELLKDFLRMTGQE